MYARAWTRCLLRSSLNVCYGHPLFLFSNGLNLMNARIWTYLCVLVMTGCFIINLNHLVWYKHVNYGLIYSWRAWTVAAPNRNIYLFITNSQIDHNYKKKKLCYTHWQIHHKFTYKSTCSFFRSCGTACLCKTYISATKCYSSHWHIHHKFTEPT